MSLTRWCELVLLTGLGASAGVGCSSEAAASSACVFAYLDLCQDLPVAKCSAEMGQPFEGTTCAKAFPPCNPKCQLPFTCSYVGPPHCSECRTSSDCPHDRPICTESLCVPCGASPRGCEDFASSGYGLCIPSTGECGNCLVNADCSGHPHTACIANVCTSCRADNDCLGIGPAACTNGHCALDDETYYVRNDPSACSALGPGTRAAPFCQLDQAFYATPNRYVFGIVGPVPAFRLANNVTSGGPWTVVGLEDAALVGDAAPAFEITGNVFFSLHRILITGSADVGILIDEARIDLDAVTVRGNRGGGLLVRFGSYVIENSLFVENGDYGVPLGGVVLSQNAAPQTQAIFAFNTVAANKGGGVTCTGVTQTVITASLLSENEGTTPGVISDIAVCVQDSTQTTADGDARLVPDTYRLTADSPCRNALSSAALRGSISPPTDIDGDARPLDGAFDCGADELAP